MSELTDAAGTSVVHYEYAPFGKPIVSLGAMAAINPFQFSSEYFDRELGLVYYNFRYYDMEGGRWISRDLIWEQGGLGLYAFVKNDYVDKYDALGLLVIIGKLTSTTTGVEDCGVVILLSHNFNVWRYDITNSGCRKIAILSCGSANWIDVMKKNNDWSIIDIPFSAGPTGISNEEGANAGFGKGADGFIKYLKYTINKARQEAESLCPPKEFYAKDMPDPDNKNAKCDPCKLYRGKASISRTGFFAYDRTKWNCCHCRKINLVFLATGFFDRQLISNLKNLSSWLNEKALRGVGGESKATYDCQTGKWSGNEGLYVHYEVAPPPPPPPQPTPTPSVTP